MDNIPVNVNSQAAPSRHKAESPSAAQSHKPGNNKLKNIILACAAGVVLLGVMLGGWFLYQSSLPAHIDQAKYQAVFFTNGQVYFGKLERLNGGYFKLNDIFYLQAPAKAANTSENPQQTTTQSASDVQLVKLGSEIHGPDDEMIMSKDQILFFENLKKDGKVTDSIVKYKKAQQK